MVGKWDVMVGGTGCDEDGTGRDGTRQRRSGL